MDNNQNKQDTNDVIYQLKNYIKQQLQSGIQPNEIQIQLKQAGWQDNLIQQAFHLVQIDVVPNNSTPLNNLNTPNTNNAIVSNVQPTQATQNPVASVKRGRFKTGWLLFKQSIRVLRHNEGLMRYLVMSFIICTLITILFAIIFYLARHTLISGVTTDSAGNSQDTLSPLGYILTFIYYIITYFIVNLYSAGLVANVLDIFHGQSDHYSKYMKIARSKSGPLFLFSIIEATVGLILRAIAERSNLLGRIIAALFGVIWSLARLFVVPIIVTTDNNAIASIKQSSKLLVNTWGENLAGRVSFGAIAVIMFIFIIFPISFLLIFIGAVLGQWIGAFISLVFVIFIYLAFSILISTASSILNTALFYYAQFKQIPAAFDPDLINSVFIKRKRRGFLGFGKNQPA